MTVLTFLALWFCASVIVVGGWVLCAVFSGVHQRGLARVRYDAQRQGGR